MKLESMLSIADMECAAQRILPASIFGYVVGGSEDQASLRGNREAFDNWRFAPRFLVDVSKRSQATELFGRRYASPFGIGPMGVATLCRYDGDAAMARAATQLELPFVLSGASTTPLESIAAQMPHAWFQGYLPSNREVVAPMMDRVARAGIDVLVVTVDVPIASTRENELRNGFTVPLRLSPRLVAGGLARPRWMVQTFAQTLLRQGIPCYENFTATRGGRIVAMGPTDHRAGRASLCWEDIRWMRERWKGHLVVKGILRPDDALRAEAIGVDGIIVSNHGGRQLDGAMAPLDALPPIVAAVSRLVVMVDGGFRRGTDVIKALALGAKFVFVGRPAMLGLAVGGEAGVAHALGLLRREIDVDLALMGCAGTDRLSADFLCRRVQ